ncbi:large ribosomal subunit protein bL35, partial [Bordetella pertussis]|uniref:large ribosomal subunit protein bL35 n=1 Tax=Bordetella pertussis TaxID=520 RepID=UPI001378357C
LRGPRLPAAARHVYRHILTKKTTKNKRQLRGSAAVHETNVASVKAMMPFA